MTPSAVFWLDELAVLRLIRPRFSPAVPGKSRATRARIAAIFILDRCLEGHHRHPSAARPPKQVQGCGSFSDAVNASHDGGHK
jgi:hypothetical protein